MIQDLLEINLLERILDIELFGEHYRLKADAEDRHAEKAVDYLIGKVENVSDISSLPKNDINRFAQLLLATLNICNDYFDLKEKHEKVVQTVQERSSVIVNKIQNTLK